MKHLFIDNAGFDVDAMSQLTKKEFVELHSTNPGIQYGKTEAELKKWLEDAYAAIQNAAKAGGTGKSKPGDEAIS